MWCTWRLNSFSRAEPKFGVLAFKISILCQKLVIICATRAEVDLGVLAFKINILRRTFCHYRRQLPERVDPTHNFNRRQLISIESVPTPHSFKSWPLPLPSLLEKLNFNFKLFFTLMLTEFPFNLIQESFEFENYCPPH